jgi:hypothetical protein
MLAKFMNPPTLFTIITAVGLFACGVRERSDLFILPAITTLSFLATVLSVIKPKSRLFILTRIGELPFPNRMTPLIWLVLSIVLVLLAVILIAIFEEANLINRLGEEAILHSLVLGSGIVMIYWALVGLARYFKPKD